MTCAICQKSLESLGQNGKYKAWTQPVKFAFEVCTFKSMNFSAQNIITFQSFPLRLYQDSLSIHSYLLFLLCGCSYCISFSQVFLFYFALFHRVIWV